MLSQSEGAVKPSKAFLCSLFGLLSLSSVSVLAQDASAPGAVYKPSLGDLMTTIQLRHAKLWYAGRLKNWPLADYQLQQLGAEFAQAATLYPDMAAAGMDETSKLAKQLGEAVNAQDEAQFEKAFSGITAQCNACHEAAGRPFINVRTPKFPSPYSNQLFDPKGE